MNVSEKDQYKTYQSPIEFTLIKGTALKARKATENIEKKGKAKPPVEINNKFIRKSR